MADQDLNSGANVDPVSTDTTSDNVQTDTQPEVSQAPPAQDTDGHGEDSNEVSSTVNTVTNSDANEEVRRKREEGKLQQVQKELREKEEAIQKYNDMFLKSPNVYKEALKSMRNMSDEEADQVINNLKQQGYWNEDNQQAQDNNNVQQPTQNIQVNPEQIAQQAYTKLRSDLEFENTVKTLWSTIPELSKDEVDRLPQEERQEKIELAQKVLDRARYDSQLTGKPLQETIMDSYSYLSGKTQEEIENIKRQAQLSGYAKAQQNNLQSNTVNVKGSTPSTSSLTEEQLRIAQQSGLDPIKDAKYFKNPGEATVVE